ncbi:Short-chain dehydrogenase/reductase SDR [Sterolibacterium denitrificans]|uniref:Short-chain dehydrogenase/reductase SDR n=1 Tax=Sterolibacterium denitrificans TaxID=157592 RepID=A0A7Z7HRP5_9PROT|nr:SDR family oxidoreductase [Sterolibacterium denitrificans]SMB27937.1 Short-chain dehydrogenase/reductase SDR [Sterolibacterium denitrificans]
MSVRDLFDLSGKVALVTGASRGLGLQMAGALGEMGARLAIVARKADELHAAAARLAGQGVDVLPVAGNLGETATIPALVDTVLAHYGQIDILVNNAGASWGAAAEDYPDAAWHKVMNLNVDALFFLTREVGRRTMLPRRSGKIINIASIAGLGGNPVGIQTIAYNTSKGAVVNFTRALAAEWGPQGINVNALCPGFFPTKMSQGLLDVAAPQVIAATPLRRLGGDEDLQGAVVYLASAASRHVTGQCLAVDGGMSVVIGA